MALVQQPCNPAILSHFQQFLHPSCFFVTDFFCRADLFSRGKWQLPHSGDNQPFSCWEDWSVCFSCCQLSSWCRFGVSFPRKTAVSSSLARKTFLPRKTLVSISVARKTFLPRKTLVSISIARKTGVSTSHCGKTRLNTCLAKEKWSLGVILGSGESALLLLRSVESGLLVLGSGESALLLLGKVKSGLLVLGSRESALLLLGKVESGLLVLVSGESALLSLRRLESAYHFQRTDSAKQQHMSDTSYSTFAVGTFITHKQTSLYSGLPCQSSAHCIHRSLLAVVFCPVAVYHSPGV